MNDNGHPCPNSPEPQHHKNRTRRWQRRTDIEQRGNDNESPQIALSLPATGRESSSERPTASPSEAIGEQELLAGLLAHSRSAASASLLLQHFPSIGHVLSAEPSQLEAFGLTTRDVALFSLIRETACRMAKAEVRTRSALSNWQALIAYLQTAMAHEQSNSSESCSWIARTTSLPTKYNSAVQSIIRRCIPVR